MFKKFVEVGARLGHAGHTGCAGTSFGVRLPNVPLRPVMDAIRSFQCIKETQPRCNGVERTFLSLPTGGDLDIVLIHADENSAGTILRRPQPESQERENACLAKLALKFDGLGMV